MDIKNRVIAICALDENDKIVKMKKLSVKWNKKIEEEMHSYFCLDVHEEISSILFEEIKKSLTVNDIKDLLKCDMED